MCNISGVKNVSIPTEANIYKRHIPADFDPPVGTKVDVTYAQARLQHTDTPTVGYRMLNIFCKKALLSLALPLSLSLSLMVHAGSVTVGQEAPEVYLPELVGTEQVSLASLRGKVVYLDFWASWCGPCRVSFPILEQLRDELGPEGFEVLAINVDENESDALKFLSDMSVSYLVVRDDEAATPQTYGILGMPTGYLIDRQGVVREIHQGFRKSDGDQLRTTIVELLGE